MELKTLKANWDAFARTDPMWSILTVPGKRGRRWDPDEFFRSGQKEIKSILAAARQHGFRFKKSTALDFGCGIGRLTQALGNHFERCYGVDIAPTMITEAQKFNRHGSRCIYLLNDGPDLLQFTDDSFDFIYAFRVLQHMRPEYSKQYVRELIRVLVPAGLFAFQLPSAVEATASSGGVKTAASEALPETAFRARLKSRSGLIELGPEQDFRVRLTVQNASPVLWPALGLSNGDYQLFVGNHWLNSRHEMLVFDDRRSSLPHDVGPGKKFKLTFYGVAPNTPGDFVLELDIGQEKVTWFKDWGSPTLRIAVRVVSSRDSAVGSNDDTPKIGFRVANSEPVMEMYGTQPEEVSRWVWDAGGRLLKIETDDSAPDWLSYRYWVTK